MKTAFALALAAAAVLALPAARADDTPTPAAQAGSADKLADARRLIEARQWNAALVQLKGVGATQDADWNNLMGYVLRKGTPPDLAASERYYDAALRIDPHHRDTLEYSGELYLMKGQLDKAQARLAALQGECGGSCSQYADLKAAIDRYKAAGNKYVAQNW